MRRIGTFLMLLVVMFTLTATCRATGIMYEIRDLGVSAPWSWANAVSPDGLSAVGSAVGPDGQQGFINGCLVGGTEVVDTNGKDAVGVMHIPAGQRAAVWSKGATAPRDLNTMVKKPEGCVLTYASGINGRGEIVGEASMSNGQWASFVTDPRRQRACLLPIEGASGINVRGEITGRVGQRPCVLDRNSGEIEFLPVPEGVARASAVALNNGSDGSIDGSSVVVGNIYDTWGDERSSHAVYWTWDGEERVMNHIPLPEGPYTNNRVCDINNQGQMVGEASYRVWLSPRTAKVYRTAWSFTASGGVVDLSACISGGFIALLSADGVDEVSGVIAASGHDYFEKQDKAVLLVPITK